ncbi:MAG TPA: excinuclease ABC subunit UvrB [Candidatus Solibacter sp.]|jgi:excinuclease ABC subunit B|nr:excinuclease ABC subunit UvrB [Candidatus Solibacter sp.]
MPPFNLQSEFQPTGDQPQAIEKLVDGLQKGMREQTLLGVTGSGKTFSVANVIQQVQRPTLVMSPNKTLAAQLCSEFREFFPDNAVEYFVSFYDYYQPEAYIPRTDTYIEKDSTRNDEIDRLRTSAMRALLTRRDVIVVASVSCIYGIGAPEDWLGESLELKKGDSIRRDILQRKLIQLQYERHDMDFGRSRFRVRGDIVDVHPAYEEIATRLEFFGDEIERILEFDPLTGEILGERDIFRLFPATQYITTGEKMREAFGAIEAEMEERCAYFDAEGKLLESQRLRQRTMFDLEMMRETGSCAGIENYSRHLSGRQPGEAPFTLMDYLPADALIVVDESHVSVPQIGGMYGGDRSRKIPLVEYGFRLPSALDNRPLDFNEWDQRVTQLIYASATPGDYEERRSGQVVEQIVRPTGLVDPSLEVRPTKDQIDDLVGELRKEIAAGNRTLITTLTKRMAEDLTEYLKELDFKVNYLHSDIDTMERIEILRDLRLGSFDVLVGINLLREGLDLPEVAFIAILDADKEGYLRGYRSLIQTIGRAARHLDGRVIMYADKNSEAMEKALFETERRRSMQVAYNREHGITAASIHKAIYNIETHKQQVAEEVAEYEAIAGMPADEVIKLSKRLEREMAKAARDLQFERAAQLRDRLIDLRRAMSDSRAAEPAPVGAAAGPDRAPGRRGGGRWRRGR